MFCWGWLVGKPPGSGAVIGATGVISGLGCDRWLDLSAGGSFQPGGGVGFFWMLDRGGGAMGWDGWKPGC